MKRTIGNNTFKGMDYRSSLFIVEYYEDCTFDSCNFSGIELSESTFIDCTFVSCNFSMTKLTNTSFNNAVFRNCKILGVHFENANHLMQSYNFENCVLNFSSFFRLKIPKTKFADCQINDADFVETDLTMAVFNNCDLKGTMFNDSVLVKVDFSTAYNFDIDLEQNKINKAKFSRLGLEGLLRKYDLEIED